MRRAMWATSMLIVGAAAAQEPVPTPAPPPAPLVLVPVPARVVVSARRPPADIIYPPPVPLVILPRLVPAQELARMETGQLMAQDDPRVGQVAALLAQATATYIEDAPRIAELTVRTCDAIRATNRPASPVAMLLGAVQAPRPLKVVPGVPPSFEDYAILYRHSRVEEGLDHAGAIARMQGMAARPPRTPAGTP